MLKSYPMWRDNPLDGLLWDSNFISSVIYLSGELFFDFNILFFSQFCIPYFLYSLWRDHPMIIPWGSILVSVLYLPVEKVS